MNPHLKYAQAVPGRSEGRRYGIIDLARLPTIIDAVEIISESDAWSDADDLAFRAWCTAYLEWLRDSESGKLARATTNNHGSWYDVQCLRLALFIGQTDLAASISTTAAKTRILAHISSDGAQPEELNRTRSYDYSIFNLHALALIATMADRVGIDLWSVKLADGTPALGQALAYIESNVENGWPHQQIKSIDRAKLADIKRLFPEEEE